MGLVKKLLKKGLGIQEPDEGQCHEVKEQLSAAAHESMCAIKQHVKAMFANRSDAVRLLLGLPRFVRGQPVTSITGDIITCSEEYDYLTSMMDWASVAYKPQSAEGNAIIDASTLQSRLGISAADMQYICNKSKGMACPTHFVAVDHARRRVMLVIRGTQDALDVLMNITASSVPFCGGYAHKGMAEAARIVVAHVQANLAALLTADPCRHYQLHVVGHSLGGGVGALVCHMLRANHGWCNARCVAIAPPPVVCEDVAREMESYVTSVVQQNDLVPRLCVATVSKLLEAAVYRRRREQAKSTRAGTGSRCSSSGSTSTSCSHSDASSHTSCDDSESCSFIEASVSAYSTIGELHTEHFDPDEALCAAAAPDGQQARSLFHPMCCPGRLLFLERTDGKGKGRKDKGEEEGDEKGEGAKLVEPYDHAQARAELQRMVLKRNMLNHHTLKEYRWALAQAARVAAAQQARAQHDAASATDACLPQGAPIDHHAHLFPIPEPHRV